MPVPENGPTDQAGTSPAPAPLAGLGALLGSSLFSRAVGLAKLLVFAPILGPAGFGAFRLAMTTSSILGAFGGLGLQTGYLRYLPEVTDPRDRARLIRTLLSRSLVSSCLVALVLMLIHRWLSVAIFAEGGHELLMALVLVSIPLFVLYQSGIGIARGLGLFRRSALGEAL